MEKEKWLATNNAGDELHVTIRKGDPDQKPLKVEWVCYFGSDIDVLDAAPAQQEGLGLIRPLI